MADRQFAGLLERTAEMLTSTGFVGELAQIRARAALKFIGEPVDPPRWTYVAPRLLRHSAAALYALEMSALANPAFPKEQQVWSRQLALAWESLARLSEGPSQSTSLLNAAISYELAGYQANSAFLAKELGSELQLNPEIDGELIIAAFLQRKLIVTIGLAKSLLANPPDEDLPWEALSMRLGDGLLADGLASACKYFLNGDLVEYERSTQLLREASELFEGLQAPISANLAYGMRSVLPQMQRRSTWHLLGERTNESRIWKRYLTLLARGGGEPLARGTTELWPSQIKALNSPAINSSESAIVRLPTSGGKTRIAEMAIVELFVNDPGAKCVFVAPYRALAFEMEKTLGSVLVDLGFMVSSAIGSYEMDEFESHLFGVADLMITTPEKLDFILRANPEIASQIKLVILDEVHIIDDANRGIKFELLLSRLKSRVPDCRFLVMSAVIPDETLHAFSNWLTGSSNRSVVSDWRPTIQRVARFEWQGSTGVIRFKQDQDAPNMHTFVPKVLEAKQYRYVHPGTRRTRNPKYPKREKKEIAAELAYTFSEQGPVLVFCTQPQWVESVCSTIINRSIRLREAVGEPIHAHFLRAETSRSLMLARSWLGEDHVATRALTNGIAPHHGRLPHALREAIEADCRRGKYRVIVATNTLAQGVNLPVRTVIIHSTWRGDSSGERSRITVRDYWNIAGRAGRAGQETEGLVLHITLNSTDRRDYTHFTETSNFESVDGALFRRLQNLVRDRISLESLEETASLLDPEILAIAVEEGIDDPEDVHWITASQHTLAAQLAQIGNLEVDPLVDCFRFAANRVFSQVPDSNWRSVYAKTGLSSWSCNSILESISSRGHEIHDILTSADIGSLSGLNRLTIDVCMPLAETQTTTQFSGDQELLLDLWINGSSIQDIWNQTVKGADSLELLTRYIDEFLGYRLPWVASGMLRIAQESWNISDHDISEYVRCYASMIKFGVPDPASAWAMASGVATREVAIQMAKAYVSAERDSDSYERFVSWMGSLSDDMLRHEFRVSGPALEDLRYKLRKLVVNPYLKPIRNLEDLLPINTEIVGTQFENRWAAARNLRVGDDLELRRDFENPVDPNAIAVVQNEAILGYLENALAQRLAPEMDAAQEIAANVSQMSRADSDSGLQITAELKLARSV